jgi:recombination protein RecR
MTYTKPLLKLIEEFQKFPGIGPKSAQRMAFHLLNKDIEEIQNLSKTILDAKTQIKQCSNCQNLSTNDPCEICTATSRDKDVICVISEPKDLAAIEKIKTYNGMYHVLGGLLSPIDGIGPEELSIKELLNRVSKNNLNEVILALDTNTEGEATTLYLHRILSPICNKITRLGFGLPVGTELEYADELTLTRALENRTQL